MNEMEQLREDIRATAPEPRPEFAARLERNVVAGFKPSKTPKPERRRINLFGPSVALACTVLIAVVIGIGSIDNGDDDSEESGSSGGGSAMIAEPDSVEESGGAARDSAGSVAAPEPPQRTDQLAPGEQRRVEEKSTALELETSADDFLETTDGVLQVADDTGSIVLSSNVSERDGKGFARYDLRVPASKLDDTLASLSRLGHVTSRTASTQDITASYVSASDRLEDARAERAALLKALEKADTDAKADALRRQIRLARERIVAAERDVRALQARANRAKVSVEVRSTGKVDTGGAWTPGDAIDDAGRILEVAAGVVVVTAAALAPVAILALLAALTARMLRRRRREAALGPR